MKADEDKLLSTADVAGAPGVTRRRVLELPGGARLPAMKVGRAYVVRASDVAELELRGVGRPPKAAQKGGKK
jgi:hypothetical protein